MAAREAVQLTAKLVSELAPKLRASWAGGKWRPPEISAKNRARLRKEAIIAGVEWPYDAPRKEMNPRVKGHKCDRLAEGRKEKIAENMAKMPEMLEQMKKRQKEAASTKK